MTNLSIDPRGDLLSKEYSSFIPILKEQEQYEQSTKFHSIKTNIF